jgi:hypothetical protein
VRPRIVPEEEIRFAAKTGFLRRSFWEEFYGSDSKSWRSRQWRSFVDNKFFLPHPSALAKDVLVPNPRNAFVKRLVGAEISAPPFVAQLEHDSIVARTLLLLSRGKVVQSFTTEAELKRRHQDDRHWFDRSEKLKFPDAILTIAGGDTSFNVALEVELTVKSQKRYRIRTVVFVINSSGIFKAISKAMKDSRYPDWQKPIGFGRTDEWSVDPVTAPVIFRERTVSMKTMAELLPKMAARSSL